MHKFSVLSARASLRSKSWHSTSITEVGRVSLFGPNLGPQCTLRFFQERVVCCVLNVSKCSPVMLPAIGVGFFVPQLPLRPRFRSTVDKGQAMGRFGDHQQLFGLVGL